MFNLPIDNSMTFPRSRRERPSLDDSVLQRQASRGSVVSQDGYLENMFRSEREVSERMNETYEEDIQEVSEDEHEAHRRRSAQKFEGDLKEKGSSESLSSSSSNSSKSNLSESDKEIVLPKVKLKNDAARNLSEKEEVTSNEVFHDAEDGDQKPVTTQHISEHTIKADSSGDQTDTDNDEHSEHNGELGVIIAREKERNKSKCKFTLDSQGSSEYKTSSRASSTSSGYKGKSAAERAFDRGSSDSFTNSRRKISPDTDFTFTNMSHMANGHSPAPQTRKPRKYAKGKLPCILKHFSYYTPANCVCVGRGGGGGMQCILTS